MLLATLLLPGCLDRVAPCGPNGNVRIRWGQNMPHGCVARPRAVEIP